MTLNVSVSTHPTTVKQIPDMSVEPWTIKTMTRRQRPCLGMPGQRCPALIRDPSGPSVARSRACCIP
jgi:hypothetical protein